MRVHFGDKFKGNNYLSDYNTETLSYWNPARESRKFLPGYKESFPKEEFPKINYLIVVKDNRIIDVKEYDYELNYGNIRKAIREYLEEEELRLSQANPNYISITEGFILDQLTPYSLSEETLRGVYDLVQQACLFTNRVVSKLLTQRNLPSDTIQDLFEEYVSAIKKANDDILVMIASHPNTSAETLRQLYEYAKEHNLLTNELIIAFLQNQNTPSDIIQEIQENMFPDLEDFDDKLHLMFAINPNTPSNILGAIFTITTSDEVRRAILANPNFQEEREIEPPTHPAPFSI